MQNPSERIVSTPYGDFEMWLDIEDDFGNLRMSALAKSVKEAYIINRVVYEGWMRLSIDSYGAYTYDYNYLSGSAKTKLRDALWPTAEEMLRDEDLITQVKAYHLESLKNTHESRVQLLMADLDYEFDRYERGLDSIRFPRLV